MKIKNRKSTIKKSEKGLKDSEHLSNEESDKGSDVNRELNEKVKKAEELKEKKEPTLAAGSIIVEEQSKKDKFKNFFKLDDSSYIVLRLYIYWFIFSLFVHAISLGVINPYVNFPLIFLMVGLATPFTSPYNTGSSWKALYVTIPVILISMLFTLAFRGPIAFITIILYAISFLCLYSVIEFLIAILSSNKKLRVKNGISYLVTALIISFILFLIVIL